MFHVILFCLVCFVARRLDVYIIRTGYVDDFMAFYSNDFVWCFSWSIFETLGQGTVPTEATASETGTRSSSSSAPSRAESKTSSDWVNRIFFVLLFVDRRLFTRFYSMSSSFCVIISLALVS